MKISVILYREKDTLNILSLVVWGSEGGRHYRET